MNGPCCSDLAVSRPLLAQKLEQWRAEKLFIDRIYWICNHVLPGIGIELEAVSLIQDLLMRILYEILDARPQKVEDMERCMRRSIPESTCRWITQWTGNYIKNIRKRSRTIGLEDLKVALGADQNLIELSEMLINDSESTTVNLTNQFSDELIKDKDYKEIASDFKHEELQYLDTLEVITSVFRHLFKVALGSSGKHHLDKIFGNIDEIYELTLKIQRVLEDAIEMSDTLCIGTGIWELCEAQEFDVYITYMVSKRKSNFKVHYSLFCSEDYEKFHFKLLLSSSLMVDYVLPSLLQVPVVHFCRYIEYIAKLHCLLDKSEEKEDVRCTKTYLNGVAKRMEPLYTPALKIRLKTEQLKRTNAEAGNCDNRRRLVEIQDSIRTWTGADIAFTSTTFIREGDLMMLRQPSPTDTLKKNRNVTDRHVFLFDQLLVLCKVHKSTKADKRIYKFKGSITLRKTEIFDLDDTEELQHAFRIQLRTSSESFENWTFLCRTGEEKTSWLTDLVTIQTASILSRMLNSFQEEEKKRYPLILPNPKQYRFAEPDTDDNIVFEDYTSSSGIPVVKNATVLKLVERLTYHLYTDNKFVQTFLTTYRSFCSPLELLQLLIERFNVPTPYQLSGVEHCGSYSPPYCFNSNFAKNGAYATINARDFNGQVTAIPWGRVEKSYHLFRKDYQRPIQLSVLRVIRQWVNQHWYDFETDPLLLTNLLFFLKETGRQTNVKNSYKDWCKNIQSCIDRKTRQEVVTQNRSNTSENGGGSVFEEPIPSPSSPRTFLPSTPPILWHTAKKGDICSYDLLTLHPLEIGRQLTLIEFDLYRAIKPIELVGLAWTKSDKDRRSPQLLRLIDHSTKLTYWVAKSIVETPSLEERVEMVSRVLEIMMVFEELNNFTGFVALCSSLQSSAVYRLKATWDRLDREKHLAFERFEKLCHPHWIEMIKRLQSINPPCVPFFGHYLSKILFYEEGKSTFVETPNVVVTNDQKNKEPLTGDADLKPLVSFVKCRRIASIIGEIQMYQKQPYALEVESSIRVC
uniref:PH domain-containing protein n=1 Tax=Syphacia muris TaxID=451379 RepID=A0A0N5AE61_9BILA